MNQNSTNTINTLLSLIILYYFSYHVLKIDILGNLFPCFANNNEKFTNIKDDNKVTKNNTEESTTNEREALINHFNETIYNETDSNDEKINPANDDLSYRDQNPSTEKYCPTQKDSHVLVNTKENNERKKLIEEMHFSNSPYVKETFDEVKQSNNCIKTPEKDSITNENIYVTQKNDEQSFTTDKWAYNKEKTGNGGELLPGVSGIDPFYNSYSSV